MTTTRGVLILGGGVAGMSAAKVLDAAGCAVHMVENQERLGGKAFEWACMATDVCRNCGACLSAELVDKVGGLARTTVHLASTVTRIDRTPQGFLATVTGKAPDTLAVDAVLLATGMQPFDPTGFQSLGYGENAQVITTAELNAALKFQRLEALLPQDRPPAIAFIQCVGSRNRAIGKDYCSQVCCKTALRQADKLLHLYPQAEISIFYLDLQTIGKEFRNQSAGLAGRVRLLQGVPGEILTGRAEGKLTVIREDYASGARQAHHFDMVVLAVGMTPSPTLAAAAAMLGATPDEWGFYGGQGASLPAGVYLAGAVQAPTDIVSAAQQGISAAHRILQRLAPGRSAAPQKRLAVFAGDSEGLQVAAAMAGEGHAVWLFDSSRQEAPQIQNIHYCAQSRLLQVQGTVGRFELTVRCGERLQHAAVDGVIVASGVSRTPAQLGEVQAPPGAAASLTAFIQQYGEAAQTAPERLIFWLDHAAPEWKSNSRQALELAALLAAQHKTVHVIMDKMLVHGLDGQRLYDQARKAGVRFLRLAEGTRPAFAYREAAWQVELAEATLPDVQLSLAADQLVIPESVAAPADSAALARGLGLDRDAEGFLQGANVRHRPVGSPRRGIFFAGGCHDETDPADLQRDIKAISAALALLDATPPSDGMPRIDEGKCVRCLTCLRSCPHAAVTLKEGRQPLIATAACFNCGVCVANCPAKAIEPLDLPQAPPPEASVAPSVVFACQRSAALAAREAVAQGLAKASDLRVIPVPCAGRVSIETLLQPLLHGSRQVIVAACHPGNCRSITGNLAAAARVARMRSEGWLAESSIRFAAVAANEPAKAAALKEEPHA